MSPARPGTGAAAPAGALSDRALILLLGACNALGPVSSLLLLPALPAIRTEFGASTAATQAVVSAFLLAFAVGIPVVGPLSDRYGRRPLILGGLGIFALGSAVAAWAPTLGVLVLARVIQAMGCAASFTVARAILGDLYQDWRLPRALANITMVMMIGTTVSPWLGGVITESLGWHAPFIALLASALIVLAVVWKLLPETHVAHDSDVSFAQLGRSSLQVLRKPMFLACATDSGVIYGVYLSFLAAAPYIMAEMLQRPATDFGLYVMLLSTGYFFGNLYVAKRAHALDMARTARLGTMLQAGSAMVALLFVVAGYTHPAFWFVPMLPLAFGQGLALPHITATAVRLAPGYAGIASSLLGFAQQTIGALAVQATGFFATDTPVPVLTFCAALSLLSVGTLLLHRNHGREVST
ncbi:MAG: multidrug effflux MFS transporter [Steroidobacteraceae bacterium]|nr:multidrug effflux MFS transporter [Nevskiaceae bacterium]MCP5339393.1 multidrug effflux MFS transporter [Nevskiaceae bacterium]MCP5466575.1 multidrug effflux MFS transporter [Nevskiaceae bacterium]MCP5471327.1 multidrug effflux MFS transporter [Nevskiaceae bacterium]